jgi:polyisoprenyl-teichoic acid--peptidoglycan teichoic acid transferase
MLLKAAIAGFVVILVSGAGIAAALYIQVPDKILPPVRKGEHVPSPIANAPVEDVKPGGPRTILVLGSDRRSKRSADGAIGFQPRSDTILLIRLDPKLHRIATLSIPRDLAVTIPGHGDGQKINSAYDIGGAALSAETVKNMFETATGRNFPINSIIDVNFNGFQRAVNYVHGVYVDVDHDYYIPPNSGISAIDLKAGYQKLVGSQALAYVRYRHTDSDLYRAARQQDFLRQAANQPAVRRIENPTDARHLLGILRDYMRVDKNFFSRKNLFGMLKTAVYLAVQHSPVNQVQFEPVSEAPDPNTDTRLFASEATLQSLYTEFMTGEHTENPKPQTARKTARRKKVDAASVSGLENARNLGENLAVLADPKLSFPFYFPAFRALGSRYSDDSPLIYKLQDESGKNHGAYRVVISTGAPGEYYGVQGTTWKKPPILDDPDRVITQNGRRLLLFYDGTRLRVVGWKTPKAVYWVSNTITHRLSNAKLIAIAASLTHLHQ